jgi:hypothetical protein
MVELREPQAEITLAAPVGPRAPQAYLRLIRLRLTRYATQSPFMTQPATPSKSWFKRWCWIGRGRWRRWRKCWRRWWRFWRWWRTRRLHCSGRAHHHAQRSFGDQRVRRGRRSAGTVALQLPGIAAVAAVELVATVAMAESSSAFTTPSPITAPTRAPLAQVEPVAPRERVWAREPTEPQGPTVTPAQLA